MNERERTIGRKNFALTIEEADFLLGAVVTRLIHTSDSLDVKEPINREQISRLENRLVAFTEKHR